MKVLSFLLLVAILLFSCGKKGPLKPPPDTTTLIKDQERHSKTTKILPPKNLSFKILDNKGVVLLSYEGDWCEQFKVYRYAKDRKKAKTPYAVTSENKFVDEFPLLDILMIYEVSCLVKDEESQTNPTIEVLFK